MPHIYESCASLIGNTPLVRLARFAAGLPIEVCAKLEFLNPIGSDKDRAVRGMLDAAEAEGKLAAGGVIVEASSGNIAFSLAALAVPRGYRVMIVMPEGLPASRVRLLRALGAEVILTATALGMRGAISRADTLTREHNAFRLTPFDNPANPNAHTATADEIWAACDGNVAAVVVPVATAGMVTGIGRRLKTVSEGQVRIVAVQPASSPLLTTNTPGSHRLLGMGAPFRPENYDASVVDEIVDITDNECHDTLLRLYRTEGLISGPAGGAALAAVVKVVERGTVQGQRVVTILPDSMERYAELRFWETFTVMTPNIDIVEG